MYKHTSIFYILYIVDFGFHKNSPYHIPSFSNVAFPPIDLLHTSCYAQKTRVYIEPPKQQNMIQSAIVSGNSPIQGVTSFHQRQICSYQPAISYGCWGFYVVLRCNAFGNQHWWAQKCNEMLYQHFAWSQFVKNTCRIPPISGNRQPPAGLVWRPKTDFLCGNDVHVFRTW